MANLDLIMDLKRCFKQIGPQRLNLKKDFLLFFIGILLVCTGELQAQNKATSGVVMDGSAIGGPLVGVNVTVKGSSSGTTTDLDGKFTLSGVKGTSTLVFSYVGYITQEVAVENKTNFTITLEPNMQTLEEVQIVSIGYGTVKKANLTGSIASISAGEISKLAVTNVGEALAGRLPGVRVQSLDGAPGSDIIIRVRGGGSISQDNAPLYVVDGLIVSNLNDIPPQDIESIDVLKDAATTAIYGSRASNGVIIVTTKSAKAGRTTVSFNTYMQQNTFPGERKYDVLSPYEFALMQYETAAMNGAASLAQFTKDYGYFDDLELYKSATPIDRQKEVLGQKGVFSRYQNINISGGTADTKLSLSYNGNNDNGLLPGSGVNRNAFNFKLNHKISKDLKIDLGARVTTNEVNGAGTSGSSSLRVSNLVTNRPTNGYADQITINPDNADQAYLEDFLLSQINPNDLVKQDWRKSTNSSYIFNGGLTWNIIKNLRANSTVTLNKTFNETLRFYGPITAVALVNGGLPVGLKSNGISDSYRVTNTLNYDFKKMGKHNLNLLVGQEVNSFGGKNQTVQAGGFRPSVKPEELFANMQLGSPQYTSQSTSVNTDANIFSVFGRANYNYDDRYLLTATLRSDASSKFAKANNTGYFPAFSAAWRMSNEAFLKGSKVIDELKIRLSYGATGNDRIPSNSTSLLFAASDSRGPGFSNNLSSVYYQINAPGSVLYNPDLKWETTIGKNFGVDFSLLNSAISGSLDIYRNETKDLLVQAQIAPISGFKYQWKNVGNTSNQGIELGLSARVYDKKDYSLYVNANIGSNRFRIDRLDGTQFLFLQSNWASTDLNNYLDYYLEVGNEVGLIYGYKNDGYYKASDFSEYAGGKYILKKVDDNGKPLIDNSSSLGVPLRPGDLKLKDLNGDGIIDLNDRTIIGRTLPKATGGFGLTAKAKGFDISAFFNWSYGNDEYNAGKIAFNQLWASNGGSYLNMLNTMNSENRFTYIDVEGKYGPAGAVIKDLATLGEMNKDKTLWSGNMSFGTRKPVLTDWAVEDASYVRFSNLNIGYTVPVNIKLISKLRIYTTGTNLALWTKYSGFDPDANNSRSDGYQALTPGLDFSSYPKNRSYTLGLNVVF
jgi:TonB-dependent starch-binding outer membrane protein SusC